MSETVMAFDATGNCRVPTPVFKGDTIEWKRNGSRGTLKLRVEEVWRNPAGRVKVYARPLEGGRRLCVTHGIFYVFDERGVRREPT